MMDFLRYHLKQNNFILSKFSGDLNDKDLMQQEVDLNRETEGILDFRQLVDLRDLDKTEELTVEGTTRCAQMEENRPESLLAILVSNSDLHYGMARSYQTFAVNKRKSVRIFQDLHEALSWLARDEQELELLKDFVNNS